MSDTLGPLPALASLCGAGVLATGSVAAGLGWGLLAMFFVAILPYVVTWKVRHPADGARPSSGTRAAYMGLAAVTAGVGLGLLVAVGAPHSVRDVVVAVLVTLVVVAVLNRLLRWSNHLAACAAGAAMLVVLFGAAGLWSLLAVPAVAWARLALGRHTWSELVGGGAAGAVVAATTLLLLR